VGLVMLPPHVVHALTAAHQPICSIVGLTATSMHALLSRLRRRGDGKSKQFRGLRHHLVQSDLARGRVRRQSRVSQGPGNTRLPGLCATAAACQIARLCNRV